MRMGYRTVYDQSTQHEYYPNRFGAYGGVVFNPYGEAEGDEKPPTTIGTTLELYGKGFKSGSLQSYALPTGILVAMLPTILKKNKMLKKKNTKKALQLVGTFGALYSLGATMLEAYNIANPKV